MLAEPVLGVNAALRVVRRKSLWGERRIDEESMPVRTDRLVEQRLAGRRSHLGCVVQASSNVLMVDSSPGSSGYSGWSNEKTWWPGWMGDGRLGLGLKKATADPVSGGQRCGYCCTLALFVT